MMLLNKLIYPPIVTLLLIEENMAMSLSLAVSKDAMAIPNVE
jgi:hypothetical protein